MTPLDFGEFFASCKDRLTDEQLRALDPKLEYFQIGGSYFGLLVEADRAWVSIAVGDTVGLRAFRDLVLRASIRFVGFNFRSDSPTHAWARYYKALIADSGEKYADGSIAWRGIIDTQQTQRLRKRKEEKESLT